MKVLVVNNYHYNKGGSDNYFLSIINNLPKFKKDIQVKSYALISKNDILESYNLNKSIKIKNTNKLNLSLVYDFKVSLNFYLAIKKFKPDLIHLNIYYGQLTSSIFLPILLKKIKVIQTSHEYKLICPINSVMNNNKYCSLCRYDEYKHVIFSNCNTKGLLSSIALYIDSKLDSFMRKIINQKIKIISVSNYQGNILKKRGVENLSILPLFHDIIHNNKRENKTFDKNNIECLVMGRIEKLKGIYFILDFVEKYKYITSLIIVGDGSEFENLRKEIKNRKLDHIVRLKSSMNKVKLTQTIENVDIIINPSMYNETFGLVNIEAMSKEKIVISSNSGALPELIEDNINGFLFNSGSLNSLAKAFERLINSDIKKVIENAKKTADLYTIENHINKLYMIYKNELNDSTTK